jgi:hypothetical protein
MRQSDEVSAMLFAVQLREYVVSLWVLQNTTAHLRRLSVKWKVRRAFPPFPSRRGRQLGWGEAVNNILSVIE